MFAPGQFGLLPGLLILLAITGINPLRYVLVVRRKVFLEGASCDVLAEPFGWMAAMGATAWLLAGWLFRRRMY